MKFAAASVLVGLASSQAFMVQPVMKLSGNNNEAPSTRGDFVKLAGGAVVGALAVAAPALAKSGDSPKQNLFGVIGSEASLGGGASNYFAGEDTYSPYSPYAAHTNSDDGSYMLKVKIDILKDVQTKIKTIPAFVEKKQWSEVQSVLTNKAYSLRDAMNTLAEGKPDAQGVAKVFYRDMENVIFSCRVKDQDMAMKSYNDAQTHLTKYLSLI